MHYKENENGTRFVLVCLIRQEVSLPHQQVETPSEPFFVEIQQQEVFASRGDFFLYFYKKRLTWWLDGCISDMP